jgi:DNA-directed RNA polymerase specialized sigma subunit
MSTEDFIKELRDKHKENIEEIEKLLEILKELQEEERRVYSFYVTSNL